MIKITLKVKTENLKSAFKVANDYITFYLPTRAHTKNMTLTVNGGKFKAHHTKANTVVVTEAAI